MPSSNPLVGRLVLVSFLVSAGLLAFEVSLLRVLLLSSWHHFAFLIISAALLGFGASGTVLVLLREWLTRRGPAALLGLVLLAAAAMPVCVNLAQTVETEARLVPALLWAQLGRWLLYWGLMTLPFLAGAAAGGLALMLAGPGVAAVYAGNLLGSAAGALLATVAMHWFAPQWLAPICALGMLAAAAVVPAGSWSLRAATCTVFVAGGVGYFWAAPPRVRIDPYKYLAYVRQLTAQGQAAKLAEAHGPRALLEVYASDLLHDLPFLSGSDAPPAMAALVADGHHAGSILDIASAAEAGALDHGLPAFPYGLSAPRARVLLLGEQAGVEIWRAVRRGAATITAVQPDPNVDALLRGPLARRGGAVLDAPGVRAVIGEPRHFIDHDMGRYDIIQLVGHQLAAASSGGFGGLAEDHLLTVEGMAACLGRLSDGGVLAVCRAIQDPPRDNLKMMATFAAALRRIGIAAPGEHIAVVRDFLGVCTMVKPRPWTQAEIARLRSLLGERNLTAVWFPGVRPDELNHPDALPGPAGQAGDWYYYAATQLFSAARNAFIDEWPFDIRPPTDDRPFFSDFCRLRSLEILRRQFGDLWMTRAELAFLFVLAAMVLIPAAAAGLIVAPLAILPGVRRARGKGRALAYFGAIGLAYLLLEMTFLSRLIRWVGDPVTATAVTIAGFLCFSGAGSLAVNRWPGRVQLSMPWIIVVLVALGCVELLTAGPLGELAAELPSALRPAAAVAAIAPLAFLMGMPMPAGLAELDRENPRLIPWAWGINGLASVLASPLALSLAMSWGYSVSGGLGLLMYLLPATLTVRRRLRPPHAGASRV